MFVLYPAKVKELLEKSGWQGERAKGDQYIRTCTNEDIAQALAKLVEATEARLAGN